MPINWGQIGQIGTQILGGVLSTGGRARAGGAHYGIPPMLRGPSGISAGFTGIPGPGEVGLGGNGYYRRRRRGITARDLASFRRVANLIKRYSRPVRSFRTRPGRR